MDKCEHLTRSQRGAVVNQLTNVEAKIAAGMHIRNGYNIRADVRADALRGAISCGGCRSRA